MTMTQGDGIPLILRNHDLSSWPVSRYRPKQARSAWSLAATFRTSQVASFLGLVLAGSAKNSHMNMFNLLSIESDPIGSKLKDIH